MFALVPREVAFLDMFQKAARNVIEGSRLLKDMMADYQNPVQTASRIKDLEHVGDEITHDIPSQNWGREDWRKEFELYKRIGIDTVVSAGAHMAA